MQGTKGVGTHSYAAPEQLASNDADWKVFKVVQFQLTSVP